MKKIFALLSLAGLLVLSSSCARVTSSRAPASNVTGEVWYVKSVGFLGLVFKTQVFYCPTPEGRGPAQCQEAKIYDENAKPTPVAPYQAAPPPPPPPPQNYPQQQYGGQNPPPPPPPQQQPPDQPRFGQPQQHPGGGPN